MVEAHVNPGSARGWTLRTGSIIPPVLLAMGFIAGAVLTWRRLGSLTVDTGRELEVPLRLLQGQSLYSDVRYYWGPLAPVVNAALFTAFGPHLSVVMWAGIAAAALTTLGLYLMARTELGTLEAMSIATAFLALGAFSAIEAPMFNFVLPHNCSATYGITCAVWSTYLLVRYVLGGRIVLLAASVLLAVACILTKVEIAIPVLATHAVHAWIARGRIGWREGLTYGVAVLAVCGTYGALYGWMGADLWSQNLALLVNPASRHYIAVTMGTEDVEASVVDMGISLMVMAALLALSWGAAWASRVLPARLVAAGLLLVVATGMASIHPQFSIRSLPVVLLASLCGACWWFVRKGGGRGDEAHVIVLAFGLACLPRILLQTGPRVYGYYLLPPALLAFGFALRRWMPRAIGSGTHGQVITNVAVVGVMVGLTVAGTRFTYAHVRTRGMLVAGPRGSLYLPSGPESEAVARLTRTPVDRPVLVLPDGAGLSFLAGHSAGRIAVLQYNPITVPDAAAEDQILRNWIANPPGVVVWSRLEFGTPKTFGVGPMGVGYARRLREWLEANYVPVNDTRSAYIFLRPRG